MHESIIKWIVHGVIPGHFLRAVIENDLKRATAYADDTNQRLLHVYVSFFYNNAPSACWGSELKLDAWAGQGGYSGGSQT